MRFQMPSSKLTVKIIVLTGMKNCWKRMSKMVRFFDASCFCRRMRYVRFRNVGLIYGKIATLGCSCEVKD